MNETLLEAIAIFTGNVATIREAYRAKSVFGAQVEPDGWDAKGAPSWLLAIGVI